jgi:protein involved in polysaccharide export with SLBB domain
MVGDVLGTGDHGRGGDTMNVRRTCERRAYFLSASLLLLPAYSAAAEEAPAALKSGDLIAVQVKGLIIRGNLKFEQHVGRDGNIGIPMAGEVKVSGMTAAAAGDAINVRLAERKILGKAKTAVTLVNAAGEALPISPGDKVRVRLWDVEGEGRETSIVADVDKEGTITLPALGKAKIGGLTESRAMLEIAALYEKAQLMMNLAVVVTRLDRPSTAPADR